MNEAESSSTIVIIIIMGDQTEEIPLMRPRRNRYWARNDRGLPPQEQISKTKAYLCEFVGTALVVFISGVAVAATGGSRAFAAVPSNLPANAFGHGFAYFVAIFLFVSQSGGHFNPAVTLAILIKNAFTRRHTGWFMIFYWFFQFAGGLLGGLMVWGVIFIKGAPSFMGVPRRGFPGISSGQVFVAEFLGSLVLIFPILWTRLFVSDFKTMTDKTKTPPYARATFFLLFNAMRALGIGLLLTALVFGIVPVSGANFNPARWLGLAVYSPKFPREWWAYLVAPFAAAIVAPIISVFMLWVARAVETRGRNWRWLSWSWDGHFMWSRKGVYFP